MANALEIRGLTKRYDGFSLENVSFSIPEGSVMGFIGENGAGKTTTIRLILDGIRRDAGEIRIFGKDNIQYGQEVRGEIGAVFDECYFPQDFRPADLDAVFRRIYPRWDAELYRSYLERFELPQRKTVKEYSRGMKMKLSIACALSHHPRLLLLDEATSGLDPIVRDEILDIFRGFMEDETHTILFSSHITSDLERLADYVSFLHKGKLLFSLPRDELLDTYGLMQFPEQKLRSIRAQDVIRFRRGTFGCEALIRDRYIARELYPDFPVQPATLDEIMILYTKGEAL
ncbi:MAG TPA: ABC transporter ATP-binding protein [Candidatus Gallacutalibacter pullicola]|uniref:ABC transporter ATP-binding protein n=1 Tax=Candidatus Gallacutalibacter pullicola TaxID=2840830 RepID=A0A9D1DNK3_9FIRM|nr:ABC transporter ATP-binding protein [Candidatus Gallacutalibacter pullicola]